MQRDKHPEYPDVLIILGACFMFNFLSSAWIVVIYIVIKPKKNLFWTIWQFIVEIR